MEKIEVSAMALRIFLFAIFILSTEAFAQTETCSAKIQGKTVQLTYESRDMLIWENTTLREIVFSNWNDCPRFVVLRHMTPTLTPKERGTFCSEYDKKTNNYLGFSLGKRDAYGRCKKPGKICSAVNSTKQEALVLAGFGAGAAGGTALATSAAGITAVTHSSGAVILTGSSGYLAGTLGAVSSSVVAALTAPATLIGAAASVVAVGGGSICMSMSCVRFNTTS